MHSSDSGLAHGTIGSPQFTIEQERHAIIAAENEASLKRDVEDKPLIDNDLIKELEKSGEKLTREDMQFITRDKTGQIVWLEKGSSSAGLKHILQGNGTTKGHAGDFKRAFGISEADLPSFLRRVISKGNVVSSTLKQVGKRMGYTRVYDYGDAHLVLTGIGTNGFIITAYPVKRSDAQ